MTPTPATPGHPVNRGGRPASGARSRHASSSPCWRPSAAEFGRERVLAITRDVIVEVARPAGAGLWPEQTRRDNGLTAPGPRLRGLAQGQCAGDGRARGVAGTLFLQRDPLPIRGDVPGPRRAELGALLSCNRDYSLVEGFNGTVDLERTQTIMQGASHCDFRFAREAAGLSASRTTPAARSAAILARG